MTANPSGKRGKNDRPVAPSGIAAGTEAASPQTAGPLKPRPRLFALLSVVFGLWVAFLVTLYFTTVPSTRSTVPGYDAQGTVEGTAPAAR